MDLSGTQSGVVNDSDPIGSIAVVILLRVARTTYESLERDVVEEKRRSDAG